MSEVEEIIKSIQDADEIEILEFDFEPCFHRLRKMEEVLKELISMYEYSPHIKKMANDALYS